MIAGLIRQLLHDAAMVQEGLLMWHALLSCSHR